LPITLQEISSRALAFSREWKHAESEDAEPHEVAVANINPYLVDAPDVLISRRSDPICPVPEIGIGNKPIDGGYRL
jgi:hypothetical protein